MPKLTKFDSDSHEADVPLGKPEPPPAATAAKAQARTTPAPVKPRYVRIQNKLPQAISLSLRGDGGEAVELKLGAHATSAPLREDSLTEQVRRFAHSGKVRLR